MSFLDSLKNEKSKNLYFDSISNTSADTAIIFIHGFACSRRYWDKDYHILSRNYSLYFVDLLGFGFSAKPNMNYTLETHTEALDKFINGHVKEKFFIFVGHSAGALVALSYAQNHSDKIKTLYLLSVPFFSNENEAMNHAKKTIKPPYFIVDSIWLRITCALMCYFGGAISRKFGYLVLRDVPEHVASDGFLHTYNSYITTLYNVVYRQNIPQLLTKKDIIKKIILIHGDKDELAPLKNVKELSKKYKLKLTLIKNKTHRVPLEAKNELIKIISKRPLLYTYKR
jgi:pimeloyl-ACP methyl ester carboxylesterase